MRYGAPAQPSACLLTWCGGTRSPDPDSVCAFCATTAAAPTPVSGGINTGFGGMIGTGVSVAWDTDVLGGAIIDVLGGACMGTDREDGVIDHKHRVFGYDGLFVIDGSAISANPGVNPALTITALAERAMSLIPAKEATS